MRIIESRNNHLAQWNQEPGANLPVRQGRGTANFKPVVFIQITDKDKSHVQCSLYPPRTSPDLHGLPRTSPDLIRGLPRLDPGLCLATKFASSEN